MSECEYLSLLADKMMLVPSRGGALFQNIQNGGRQSLTSTSKPSLQATLAAKVIPYLGLDTPRRCWQLGLSAQRRLERAFAGAAKATMQDVSMHALHYNLGLFEVSVLLRHCP